MKSSSKKTATLYQIRDGTRELLGQIPIKLYSHSYLIQIPAYLLKKADCSEFTLSLSRTALRLAPSDLLQIRHGRFTYDVFLKHHITYALPVIKASERRLIHGHP